MKNFPHMKNPEFPQNDGNVYQYENLYDYKFWVPNTKLKLLNVNWDLNYDNAPGFESNSARESWFAKQSGFSELLTIASELMPDGSVKLPLDFSEISKFNYLQIEFPDVKTITNQRRYWYFFIRDFESLAKNTTKLYLQLDVWTCYINDIDISGMILARGHYAIANSDVDAFLKNPYANNDLLLAPDVAAVAPRNISSTSSVILNDEDIYVCFVTTAHMLVDWGNKDDANWRTPAPSYSTTQGVNAPFVFALKAADLNNFLSKVDQLLDNFKSTVQCVFFAPEKLLKIGDSFTFCDHTLYKIDAKQVTFNLLTLNKQMFGYDSKIADLAKLYTFPYAIIEITDGKGDIIEVKIEDTTGTIDLRAMLNIAYPSISIDRYLTGINGANESITFTNITSTTLTIGGDWYKTLSSWNVQLFAVYQNAQNVADWSTFYKRRQAQLSADNSYTTSVNSANTALANTNASADNMLSSVQNSSAASVANTATQVTANSAITARSNSSSAADTSLGNSLSQALQAWDAGFSRATTQAEIEGQMQSAAVSMAGTAVSTAASIASNPASAIGAIANGIVSGVTTAASTAITTNLASTKTEAAISNSQSKTDATNTNNSDRNSNQISTNSDNTSTQNAAATAITAQNAATANTNASTSSATQKSNAQRSRDTAVNNAAIAKSTAESAIKNTYAQGGLNAPSIYGNTTVGNATTRPLAMFANVVTLPKGVLNSVAAQFKRYGYTLNQYIDFTNFNLMKNFTYWKANELWVTGATGVPEISQERIKTAILNGVTVWRDPTNIGKVNIYDN